MPSGSLATHHPLPMAGSETILLVEDEAMLRRLACTMLGRRGYRVLVAATGAEALALAAGYGDPIHLLLSDMVMPNMGGAELAERIRSLRPEARVLLVSGYPGQDGELGAFLQKPFTAEQLTTKVREILDARQPVSA